MNGINPFVAQGVKLARLTAGSKITVSMSPTFDLFSASASVISFFGSYERLLAKENSVRTEVSVPLRVRGATLRVHSHSSICSDFTWRIGQRKNSANRFRSL